MIETKFPSLMWSKAMCPKFKHAPARVCFLNITIEKKGCVNCCPSRPKTAENTKLVLKQHDLSSANLLIEQVQLLFHAAITGITLEHDVYPI